jgi:glycosyl hydrolase family 62
MRSPRAPRAPEAVTCPLARALPERAAPTPPGEGGEDVSLPGGGLMAPSASSGDDRSDGGVAQGTGAAVTCELPATLRWVSSPPLVNPKAPEGRELVSIKDPSIVFFEGQYHVFASVYETTAGAAGYKSVYFSFSDFAQADAAPQIYMPSLPTGSTVAPQVFYFAPQGLWYLIYQWGARYSTNPDIADPTGWTAPRPLLAGEPPGALDFWVICDDTDCHLFFSRDDGVLYKSKTPLGSFPSFTGYEVVMSEPSPGLLFEASNVYAVDGTDGYLLLVEAYGPRYFRSWTAQSIDGPWQPLADTQQNPFAGAANVTFDGERWSDDVSHGELLRSGIDQRLTINPCQMQYLYQGTPPGFQGPYDEIPYRLGLLTQQ